MKLLKSRSFESELLDKQDAPFAEYHHCLQTLETINRLTFAYYPTKQWLKSLLSGPEKPRHILDVGSGGGDMLRQIEGFARQIQPSLTLTGIDLNPLAKRSALISANENSVIKYINADIFDYKPAEEVDIAICSLFTHHLDDKHLRKLLRWLDKHSKQGWFINDLHRHWIPYYFIKGATAVFSRNRLIKHDAPLSVARAFTKQDWQTLLQQENISGSLQIKWFFPFRWCISCRK